MSRRITVDVVLEAYCQGFFPMGDPRGRIQWYSPDPRCIFELNGLRISRSLRQKLRREVFDVRVNTAFRDVIAACANEHGETWISAEIMQLYVRLHELGWAHSVESWAGGQLAGGLYGVAIGGAFFGESMFHRATDASKVALVRLVERMRTRGFTLLDTQWSTPHLESLGAIEIPRGQYLARLAAALKAPVRFCEDVSS